MSAIWLLLARSFATIAEKVIPDLFKRRRNRRKASDVPIRHLPSRDVRDVPPREKSQGSAGPFDPSGD